MKETPNFLTCPAFPQLPPHKDSALKDAPKKEDRQQRGSSPSSKKKWFIKALFLVLVAGFLILLAMPAVALGKAAWYALETKDALRSLESRLRAGDYQAAMDEAARAKFAAGEFGKALQGMGFLRDAPFFGTQIRAMQEVAAVGENSLDSVSDLLEVATAMTDAMNAGTEAASGQGDSRHWQELNKEEKREVLSALRESLPRIRLARDKIDLALALWENIPKDRMLPAVSNALQPLAKALPMLKQAMDQSVPLLEAGLPLAGHPEPRKYLVILQNSDEMRPSGGFIGGIARLDVDRGNVNDFKFFDVYNVDNPVSGVWKEQPPEPLARNLAVKAWFMRDANWSPDFPESGGRVMDFYIREMELQGIKDKPDTIIALQPEFFRKLLRLVGPISINGKAYDDRNFMDLLEYEVEMGFQQQGIKLEDRKDIVGQLGAELLSKIQRLPRSDWPKLTDLLTKAGAEKQIMVYSTDQELQAQMDRREWSGKAKATACDFVWIADANLGALKTDGKMIKKAEYELDATDVSRPVAKVTLTYENTTSKIDWRYTRYRSYTRLYVPEGSALLSSAGAMQGDLLQTGGKFVAGKTDVMKELGKTVFGAFWSVEPGRTGKLSFSYALPEATAKCLADNSYRLDWQKQPGADDTEINVSIKGPRSIRSAEPPEPESKWGDAVYQAQSDLREDRVFKVSF